MNAAGSSTSCLILSRESTLVPSDFCANDGVVLVCCKAASCRSNSLFLALTRLFHFHISSYCLFIRAYSSAEYSVCPFSGTASSPPFSLVCSLAGLASSVSSMFAVSVWGVSSSCLSSSANKASSERELIASCPTSPNMVII